jgi:hypothetical protein
MRAGLYRDAERQFKSSLKDQDMLLTQLELVKVRTRLHRISSKASLV